jgi:hypothetical protein
MLFIVLIFIQVITFVTNLVIFLIFFAAHTNRKVVLYAFIAIMAELRTTHTD